MKPLPRILVAALLLSTFAVLAQVPAPSPVQAVAQAIRDHYFDAARGAQIADGLLAAAGQGELPDVGTPEALADAMTARLKPLDRHFKVQWNAPGADSGPSPGGPRRAGGPLVRKVEVLPGNIGLLSLGEFAHFRFGDAEAPARREIDAALARLAGTDAMVIDLRDNPGGSPNMVGYLTSAFTPRGADIYNTFHTREGLMSEAPLVWHPSPRLDEPVYLLINGRTGSAAEAFAYTMKNAGRATVVGEASGGAANPGRFFDLGDGFRVFVSTGSPVSPVTGTNWEATGVQPDLAVASDQALERALQEARAGLSS
jgi:hypothetical protein